MRRRWLHSRREVLRDLGLGLGCLPLLQATRSYAASPPSPRRFVCVLQPFGYRTDAWLPERVGPMGRAALPASTSPLTPYQDELIFLPGLTNPGLGRCHGCGPGAYGATFGVARVPVAGYAESGIATVDQVVAQGLARAGRVPLLPTLPLGVMVDAGPAALPLGARRCFWREDGQPVHPRENPHALFAQLFGGTAGAAATQRLQVDKRSLLDYVGNELQAYGKTLGTEDRQVIEIHQQAIREVERGLAALPPDPSCAPALGPPIAAHSRANFAAIANLQLEMTVAALRCDLTRVVTLQLADARGSGVSLDFVPGIPGAGADWGRIARAPARPTADPKRLADRWFMGLFARLLGAMSAGPAGATLLDHSAVLWATTMNDGDSNAQKLPWLLAGKCGGYFRTGQVADSAGKPLHGVLAEICNALQVPVEFYGDRAFGAPMAGLAA
jgi:hypothetical protein